MVSINYAFREVSCKIVYYGPGLSGKTTNLQYVHKKVPTQVRGELISLATDTDRTLFFDFMPLNLGTIQGFSTKFQLYTVPGQVFYNATRKLVLRGVDGIVFVADSQLSKMDENKESLENLIENLKEYGYEIQDIPLLIQYNKRDLPEVASIDELQQTLNSWNVPYFEAVAVKGVGVFDTLKGICKIVMESLRSRANISGQSQSQSPAAEPPRGETPKAEIPRIQEPKASPISAAPSFHGSIRKEAPAAPATKKGTSTVSTNVLDRPEEVEVGRPQRELKLQSEPRATVKTGGLKTTAAPKESWKPKDKSPTTSVSVPSFASPRPAPAMTQEKPKTKKQSSVFRFLKFLIRG